MRWIGWSGLCVASMLVACGGGGSTERVAAPVVGLYESLQFSTVQLAGAQDVVYSTRPNAGGVQYTSDTNRAAEQGSQTLSLTLDISVPPTAPATSPQPLIVYIHGGGFFQGAKEDVADKALTYALAGYVVATVNYRLTPVSQIPIGSPARIVAINQAAEDVMNAIRFLKTQAATYHIDPNRVATIGVSAGGALSLINAVQYDQLDDAVIDYPGVTSKVNAAVSTGATLIEEGVVTTDYLTFDATDTPVMLFHANPTDGATGATWEGNVLPTQKMFTDAGASCTLVAEPNLAHTVSLEVEGPYWEPLEPFLLTNLQLQ